MGSHCVTCHPTEVTFPPLPQPKLVLDLATTEAACKNEACYRAVYRIICKRGQGLGIAIVSNTGPIVDYTVNVCEIALGTAAVALCSMKVHATRTELNY